MGTPDTALVTGQTILTSTNVVTETIGHISELEAPLQYPVTAFSHR